MVITYRMARAIADATLGPPVLTPRQQRRQANILTVATEMIARFGLSHCSMRLIAHALRIGTATLRWHFSDLDCILAEILRAHLAGLTQAIADVPQTAPDAQQRKRAAFRHYTRGANATFTHEHLLLVRDRSQLPPDLAEPIEAAYQEIGICLAGTLAGHSADALAMLDTLRLTAPEIETRLALLANPPPRIVPSTAPRIAIMPQYGFRAPARFTLPRASHQHPAPQSTRPPWGAPPSHAAPQCERSHEMRPD
jgi:AcrR family transcriptional regulator